MNVSYVDGKRRPQSLGQNDQLGEETCTTLVIAAPQGSTLPEESKLCDDLSKYGVIKAIN